MTTNSGGVILFAPDGSTWGWDGKRWTNRQNLGPGPRTTSGLAFDVARNRTVLFGGLSKVPTVLGDTWELVERTAPLA
jgi:hypothetical protein